MRGSVTAPKSGPSPLVSLASESDEASEDSESEDDAAAKSFGSR